MFVDYRYKNTYINFLGIKVIKMAGENEKTEELLNSLKGVIDYAKESVEEINFNIEGLHGEASYNMVEDFLYSTLLKNYRDNLYNEDVVNEYGITSQKIKTLEKRGKLFFEKCEEQGSLEKELQINSDEYQKFKELLSEIDSNLFGFLKDLESYVRFDDCITEMDNFKKDLEKMKQTIKTRVDSGVTDGGFLGVSISVDIENEKKIKTPIERTIPECMDVISNLFKKFKTDLKDVELYWMSIKDSNPIGDSKLPSITFWVNEFNPNDTPYVSPDDTSYIFYFDIHSKSKSDLHNLKKSVDAILDEAMPDDLSYSYKDWGKNARIMFFMPLKPKGERGIGEEQLLTAFKERQKKKVQRWKKALEEEVEIEKTVIKLLENKIIPTFIDNQICIQSELYENQNEELKNAIREIILNLSSGIDAPIKKEKYGRTYKLYLKNKNKFLEEINKIIDIRQERLNERLQNIKEYEEEYVPKY